MSETSLVQTAKGPASAEKSEALSSLMYATNRDDETTRALCDEGLLTALMNIEKNFPPTNKCWDDDSAPEGSREDWWLAFDVLTNICKWKSCRDDVIKAGVVEFLAPLALKENYFGFEATEGLAYVVGRDEQGKHSKLLQGRPKNVAKIIEVLDSTLNGNGSFFGMGFSTYGRVLAVQSLSVSDANKPMLIPAIPLMVQVIQRGEDRCLPLALQFLLEMTFVEDIMEYTRTLPGIRDVLSSVTRVEDDCRKLAETLLYRFDQDAKMVKIRDEGLIVVSCCDTEGALVKEFVERLRGQNLHVFFTLEDAKDDVELLGDSIQRCTYFFMCMSEDYRSNANCRGEATFARKAKKAMCPLMVQAKYEPSGWLGILAGQQMYYMLTKMEELDACCAKVIPLAMQALQESSDNQSSSPRAGGGGGGGGGGNSNGFSLPATLLKMTTEDVSDFIVKKCNLPKSALYVKKNGVTGKTLGMFYDHFSRGGAVMDNLMKLLGLSSVGQAHDVLYEINALCSA